MLYIAEENQLQSNRVKLFINCINITSLFANSCIVITKCVAVLEQRIRICDIN